MESGNAGASSEGVLVPVSESSGVFQNNILAPLKSAYLYEESKQSFRYESAVLVKNSALEEKYNAFRAKRKEAGYSDEDLQESFGFLLFDDVNKANALGETGVLTGNSICTTLGDPSNGVYISMYSDCLDLNRWYHGKSGYIAMIRMTKGKVKRVLENYTQNFTALTVGFDCHVSEQLPSVSANTSSFLAFERTQYYMYELLDDGSNAAAQSPSAACPFAIVSFSYTDTKATLAAPREKGEEKRLVCHYFPWRGQLQVGTQLYDVKLRSTAGALIPAKMPPVVKIDRAISMFDLRQLLPGAVFETCFSGEVSLDGLYCSLFELFSSEAEETNSLSSLLQEIKEKDLALTIQLNDGGFLILLHSSNFLTYDDTGSNATEVLQGMFVFPVTKVIQRAIKFGQRKPTMSPEILRVLPVLSYAEGEVEKTPIDPGEELCEVLAQHMQSYAALINPGLALSPSKEVSVFPDQYDVPDAHKHLYSSPEWTEWAWQTFRSYLSKPVSFQLPVSKASEILAAGQEERIEDLDDDVYICPSSPEEAPANPVSMEVDYPLTGPRSPVNVETLLGSCITSAETQLESAVPQNVVPDDLQVGNATKDTPKSGLTVLNKSDDMGERNVLIPPTSDDLPAELIVSITSAEQTVTDESLNLISTVSTTKHNDFQLSDFSTAKLHVAGVNSLNVETVLDFPEVTNLTKTKARKLCSGHATGQKKVETLVEDGNSKSQKEVQAEESSDRPQLSIPLKIDRRIVRRRKCTFRKSSKNEKVSSASFGLAIAEEKNTETGQKSVGSSILMELEAFTLRKKTERSDLKPVISECGRILVPHGSVDIADQIKSFKNTFQSAKDDQCHEKMFVDNSVNVHDIDMEQDSSTASETLVDKTDLTTSKDEGDHLQNAAVSNVSPEHSILKLSDDGNSSLTSNRENSEHSLRTDGTATPPSEAVTEKHTDTPSAGKIAKKGEFLLSKLKSVLLRGKRKMDLLESEQTTADTSQDTEPCLKKGKVGSDTGMLKSNYVITSVQETNARAEEVSKMLSVDPLFAYALGLTPKETPDNMQKCEGQDTQLSEHSSDTQEQTLLDKQPQIIQKPSSIFPRRGRIKMLKKHQDIPAECVKKKWWLHFQTPACYASENLKYKDCTRDNSVRKTVKEKMNSACSSTDALNLLADLALSASIDQVPPQLDPAFQRKPEPSLKKCDLTKDVTGAEQESVLHALLRKPAARPTQPLESPSPPSHLVGCSEVVGLVSKEHAYSLPPSSSLLLGLPGTPFQVSPLSGSTRLLHHHQAMYGDGIKILQPNVSQEDRSEQDHRTPEYLKKNMMRRRKFRHCRAFVDKNGSIQVTKRWKENYDFNQDSKFTSDSKDKAIVRALHGPWDFSMQDTSDEVRLIVHMWIGLFYSRSTARFFHVDSNQCSEQSDSLEMSSETGSSPAQSELKANSFTPFPNETDTSELSISKALDLSKKHDSVLDNGSVILDLSLRNSNAGIIPSDPEVTRKQISVSGDPKEPIETLNTLKSSVGLQEASKIQCYKKMAHYTQMSDAEIINEVNDVRRSYENMRKNAGSLQRTDVPSCKVDGTFIPVQKEMGSAPIQPEHKQTTSGTGHVLHGCNNRKTFIKDGNENSEAIERLVEKHGRDSSKSVTDEEISSNKEADDVSHTVEHDEIECKDAKNWEVEEKPYQGGDAEPSPKVIQTEDYSANGSKLSDIVCNGIHLENEKLLSREEPIALSPDNAENFNEDVDICTVQKGQAIQEEDSFGKQNALDETDTCISPVEADSNLNAQPVPMMCDGPDSGKKNYIIECDPKPPLGEQPPEVDKEEDASHDLQLRKLCANDSALTDEHAISEKTPHIPSEMEAVPTQPAVEEHSEKDICLAEKAHYQTAALPMSVGKSGSLAGSYANGPLLKTNDSVETRSQNKEMANYKLSCNDLEDENSRSIWGEQKVDNATEKEDFHHQSHPIQCEAQVVLTEETDLKQNEKTNERLEEVYCGVIIPLIGIDGEDTAQPHDFYSQVKVEAAGQEEIPFTSETTDSKKTELSAGKISIPLLDVSETNELVVSGNESDDRCPTPTMDEKPYEYLTCSGPSNNSASAFSGNETFKNMKCLHTSINDEVPHKSKVNDIEKRTLRVLQSIDVFLSESSHTDTSSQIKTADLKHSLDQTPNPRSKYIPTCSAPSHTSSDFEDIEISNTMPAVVSVSATQDLHIEPTSHFLTSPFKSKLEEVLGVKLQLSKTDLVHQHNFEKTDKLQETSVGQDWSHSCRSIPPTDSFEAIKPNIDQDRHKTTSQTNLSQEPHSFSQRPVMAVKPSKSDESQADCISKDRQIENAVMSHFPINKQTKPPVVTYTTPTTRLLEKKTESLKGTSEGLNDDMQNGRELSSRSSWLSKVDDSKSNTGKAKLVLLDQHQVRDISKFNKIPSSSLPMQSCESAKSSSKLVDGNQGFMPYDLVEKVGQTTTESIEMDQKDCSDPSTSYADYKDGGIIDECLFLGPQSSLVCTINNTSQNRSYSILDQVSQRCLQDDPTEASMEQECLIFSDQMKQLLKKSKRGSIRQQDTHGKISLSCPGPVTVHFGSLEEQEDVEDHLNSHLDAVSLVGQKIKVDMPERKDVADTAEEEKTLHPQELSRGTGNPMEHAEVSGMISEEARLYEEMMNDVCAVRKGPSRPQHFRMDRGYPRIEQSNHFDFCDQMKREMDDCFRSNLNSVVKKSCKTKYGFYILVTSDDPFFVETKAQLEAEGHTAVQPSEFFLDEDSYSSLIIVLRNEDIAEHICEVPHLLELKKSPRVQFAGIDEPDDVVNLTHQELLTRGGFIMFDRAALEPLSICNIKKMSEVLQELNKTGKWKWILHYRDSRRMKENARLSADAKEKKNYLNWCQEAGILEVLPYHECDLMSRDKPDYLTCLVRLQVQNILSRYPVFITATATNSSFGKKGILAMTFDSFLTYSPDKKCTA